MRIAYIITRADAVGGASIHVRDLSRAMVEAGHTVLAIAGGSGPVTEQFERAGVPLRSLRHLQREINPVKDALAYGEVKRALSGFAPDLVSAHTAKAGWIGRAAARSLDIPAIYTPHGLAVGDRISRAQGRVFTVAERIAAPWAQAIICVSEAERRLALDNRIAPPGKLRVIHNGVHDVDADLRAHPGEHPPRLICVARFEPPKDHSALLTALAAVKDSEWSLTLVGEGPLESEIRAQASALGLTERVRFAGYLPDPATELARSQAFVLSSRSEGFPRSVLEAMRAGLPVVASDVGGVREAVFDGETGCLGLDSLRRVITDGALRQRLGANGRRLYESRFTFQRTFEATCAVYRETAKANASL